MTAPAQPPEPAPASNPTNPPDTTPRPRLAGRLSYNLLRRNRPHTLSTWSATTASPPTARRLASLLGGHPQPGRTPATRSGSCLARTTPDAVSPTPAPGAPGAPSAPRPHPASSVSPKDVLALHMTLDGSDLALSEVHVCC